MKRITQGIPQGSIFGPILFNIYINDIVNITEHSHFIIYADDTSMFIQSSDVNYLENQAHDALSKLIKWSKINSLEINAVKTKALLFTPPQKCNNQDIEIYVVFENIQLSTDVITLGVAFNKHLT